VGFLFLLLILGAVALRVSSPDERKKYLGIAMTAIAQLKAEVLRPRPAVDEYHASLRARSRFIVVTPAIVAINALVFLGLAFGAGAMADPATLLGWGASLGPLTTNGEWWRLLTSLFLHNGLFYLLVSAGLLLQIGVILERVAGPLPLALVYVLAGVSAGLVHLSSHPVDVAAGSTGALFGLYGLLVATIGCQQLLHRRVVAEAEPAVVEDTEFTVVEEAKPRDVRMPLIVMNRLAIVAALFIAYVLASGRATGAEPAALGVGLVFGLAVALRVGKAPEIYRVAIAAGAIAAFATAYALPLREIADVKPEIARLITTEDQDAKKYQTELDAYKKGRTTADQLAQLVERTFMPELHAADARLRALKNVPEEHQPLVADAREYIRLRYDSWRLRAIAFRTNLVPRRDAKDPQDASWRLQTEKKFRSNMAAIGNAESAERTALAAFDRLRGQKSN
jgi:membrane associated rhomboid family serine protease